MKKAFVCIYIILFCFQMASAQRLTLNDAIKMALENRWELKNQQLQVQLAEGENDKLKAKWLPQVNASADMRWNTQLQTSVFKNAPFANGQDVKLVLGVPFNNNLGLSAEQKVYDAATKYDRQLNQATVQSQTITLEKLKSDLKLAVTEAYFAALFQREKLVLAEKTVERTKAYWEAGKTKFEKGALLKNDLDRLVLEFNNAQSNLNKSRQDEALSVENLKYQIGLKSEVVVELTENLTSLFLQNQSLSLESTIDQRPEILQEQAALKINELTEQKQKARLAPVVSAYGNYTALQLNDTFNPFASGTWFPFNYIGMKLNVPVFDGKQTALLKRDYAIKAQVNRNNVEKLKADFGYEVRNTTNILNQEKINLEDTKANLVLAQQILETDRFRYEKGTILLSDLKNTEYSLQSAENNYLTSVYNFLVAAVRYKKAVGGL
ncbi:transporter [Runella rosea]|uniref:Transporter n=2 Tax=Runella rosea TaxID=2259595 RepID=A0A344TDG4_9BACT|nr:transporter [Runella rosea]